MTENIEIQEEALFTEEHLKEVLHSSWYNGAYTSVHNALNHIKASRNDNPDFTIDNMIDVLSDLVEMSKEMKDDYDAQD